MPRAEAPKKAMDNRALLKWLARPSSGKHHALATGQLGVLRRALRGPFQIKDLTDELQLSKTGIYATLRALNDRGLLDVEALSETRRPAYYRGHAGEVLRLLAQLSERRHGSTPRTAPFLRRLTKGRKTP